jgi:hypothetical protein
LTAVNSDVTSEQQRHQSTIVCILYFQRFSKVMKNSKSAGSVPKSANKTLIGNQEWPFNDLRHVDYASAPKGIY